MKALVVAEGKLYVGEPRWFDGGAEVKDSERLQSACRQGIYVNDRHFRQSSFSSRFGAH